MSAPTALDLAHGAMEASPDDDAARLRFYQRLAESELFLMLAEEADESDRISPEIFEVVGARYVLVFDREERLSGFAGEPVPYVALSGRSIAGMLDGQGVGLGVNLGVAPSAILLPDTAVAWLNDTLAHRPDTVQADLAELLPPKGLPDHLVAAIDGKLATATGLAQCAYLMAVTYQSGARGHLLAFVGAVPDAEDALARAASEALTFSGIEAGTLDIGFFRGSDPLIGRMDRVGLKFDLPQFQEPALEPLSTPGADPDKPPRLR